MAKKFTMSVPDSMRKALELEQHKRKLDNIQETIRSILANYFKEKENQKVLHSPETARKMD